MRRRLGPHEVYPAGDPHATARVLSVNGRRLRVVEAGPAGGSPVVLVPGWASGAYVFRRNLPALGDAGLRAIAVELPGQGESDKPTDPGFYTVPRLRDELAALLDALGLARAALVGQSLGGAVAVALAHAAPERVSKLALLAPAGFSRIRLLKTVRTLLPLSMAPLARKLAVRAWWAAGLRLVYGGRSSPTERDVDEYWAPSRDPAYVAALLALIHRIDWGVIDGVVLRSLRVPVLVMCGSADRLMPCDEAERRAKLLPNARTIVIQGAGHPIQEETPDEVNRALVEFLRV